MDEAAGPLAKTLVLREQKPCAQLDLGTDAAFWAVSQKFRKSRRQSQRCTWDELNLTDYDALPLHGLLISI